MRKLVLTCDKCDTSYTSYDSMDSAAEDGWDIALRLGHSSDMLDICPKCADDLGWL